MLNGGDLTTYVKNPRHLKEHADNLKAISSIAEQFSGQIIDAIGNHEPISLIDELYFLPSGLIKGVSNSSLNIALCQPTINDSDGKIIYSYDSEKLSSIFNNDNSNAPLITMGHFAFDRPAQGFPEIHPPNSGYAYQESAGLLRTILKEKETSTPGSIISLHGHEHRFRLSTSEGFPCLTMPSIVQEDPLKEDEPCGLFAEINLNDNTGQLSVTFKKIILNEDAPEKSDIKNVSQAYMQKYFFRPYVPKVA